MKPVHVIVLLACLAAGFAAGRLTIRKEPVSVPGERFSSTAAPSATRAGKRPGARAGMTALVEELSRRDAAIARGDYGGQLSRAGGKQEKRAILARWAKEDPAGLWRWLQEADAYYAKAVALDHSLFEHWIDKDIAATAAALEGVSDSVLASSVQGHVVNLLTGDDPAAAARITEHLERLLPGPVWDSRGRGGQRPDADDLDAIQALPASKAKERLRRRLVQDWYATNWQSAAAWVESLPPDDREATRGAILNGGIPFQVTRRDPALIPQFADWLVRDAPEDMREIHSRELVKHWAKTDPVEAQKWAALHLRGATLALVEADLGDAQR